MQSRDEVKARQRNPWVKALFWSSPGAFYECILVWVLQENADTASALEREIWCRVGLFWSLPAVFDEHILVWLLQGEVKKIYSTNKGDKFEL